jgi:hypothetical protein
MTKTGFLATAGFIAFMSGLYLWTVTGDVAWSVIGFAWLLVCFALSDEEDNT